MSKILNLAVDKLKDQRPFVDDLDSIIEENEDIKDVLYTAQHLQLVAVNIPAGEDIGVETHDSDQFFKVEEGVGKCIINGHEYLIEKGMGVIIPSKSKHNIVNDSDEELKLFVIYSPPKDK